VKNHLQLAIDQLLAGKAVEPTSIESVGCLIGRVRPPAGDSPITYSNQIARIFRDRCVQCHRTGEIAPFALSDYSEVAGWAETIAEVVRERRMPPWHASKEYGHFRNDVSLSDEERDQILQWAAAGAPEGNPKDLPEARQYVEGWTLPWQPDQVVAIHEKPYAVPATGEVRYQFFTVDPGFTEGKWIKASQIVPGEPSVLLHVLCFVVPKDGRRREIDENGLGFLSVYVPGYRAAPFPEGMAKYVPAGSKLLFQMHYTPVGKPLQDVSKIGLVFAKPSELTHMVQTVSTGNRGFAIPPRTDDYRAEATMPSYKHDLRVLSYAPHMHVRGKAFRYEALYPDGKREILLDVPRYDFNWQTTYELAEEKILPAGTRVHCVAHWDNSESNLANPDPSTTVRWGDQTWEEMMLGFFDVAIPIDREKLLADGAVPRLEPVNRSPQELAEELISQFDSNRDGKLTADEVPPRFAGLFTTLDANKDGALDKDEVTALTRLRGAFGGRGGRGGRD
jgi:mono/diheme cytochrome c family protein